jgi:hypothetical protein
VPKEAQNPKQRILLKFGYLYGFPGNMKIRRMPLVSRSNPNTASSMQVVEDGGKGM